MCSNFLKHRHDKNSRTQIRTSYNSLIAYGIYYFRFVLKLIIIIIVVRFSVQPEFVYGGLFVLQPLILDELVLHVVSSCFIRMVRE